MSQQGEKRNIDFVYQNGKPVMAGDIVMAAGLRATVHNVIKPGTPDARDFHCEETGGLFLAFENGDRQLWPRPNEDLKFLNRPTNGEPSSA
jgi:hypothetical protein